MPELKPNRLTDADYVIPDPTHNRDIAGARGLLMEATLHTVPEVFNELAESVFPHYDKRMSPSAKPGPALEAHFQAALTQWARRFHIQEGWLMDLVPTILDCWRRNPADLAKRKWFQIGISRGFKSDPVKFGLTCEGWDMLDCSWGDYKKYVHRQLDEALAIYEQESRETAKSLGFVPARQKFSASNLHWFALYQFGGRSYGQIAKQVAEHDKDFEGDESTIRKGVKTAQQLLSWERLRGDTKKKT